MALGLATVTGAVLAPDVATANDFIELRNGNSIYRTNIFTFSADQASWSVDGLDQQFTDQYFFNFGTSPTQRALELRDLSLLSLVQPAENRFRAEFSTLGGSLNFSLDSSLTGFATGSRRSYREDIVTISNTGSSAVDFTLFSYIDFDLLNFENPLPLRLDAQNDTTFYANNLLTQTDPTGTKATVAVDQLPTAVQVAEYPFLISQLKNEMRPQLVNVPGPLTNRDGAAAFQFDRGLQPGRSISFRFVKQIEQTSVSEPVPEPATLVALGVVGGGLMLLRRR
ncbi:MAG: PEP-CTERM sorting domain-containing protein [Leptolyngbyaceae cyanobacterium SM2_5_2]|nr:PEP-CTERM sorting domain-containing protein [Leptolyngbyaceae cyanobacterium SM2_5_2]